MGGYSNTLSGGNPVGRGSQSPTPAQGQASGVSGLSGLAGYWGPSYTGNLPTSTPTGNIGTAASNTLSNTPTGPTLGSFSSSVQPNVQPSLSSGVTPTINNYQAYSLNGGVIGANTPPSSTVGQPGLGSTQNPYNQVSVPPGTSTGTTLPYPTQPTPNQTPTPIAGTAGNNPWYSTPGYTGVNSPTASTAAASPFGPNPFVSGNNVTGPNGVVSSINPSEVGSAQLAQQVAQMLGGTVTNAPMVANQVFNSQPQPWVTLPNGQTINPADIASLYTHGYPQSYINQLTSQAIQGQGLAGYGTGFEGGMNPTQAAAANQLAGGAYTNLAPVPGATSSTLPTQAGYVNSLYAPGSTMGQALSSPPGNGNYPFAWAGASPAAGAVLANGAVNPWTGGDSVGPDVAPTNPQAPGYGMQQFLNLFRSLVQGQISPTLANSSIQAAIGQGIDPSLLYLMYGSSGTGQSQPLYNRAPYSQFP